jgi:hypothetical protein
VLGHGSLAAAKEVTAACALHCRQKTTNKKTSCASCGSSEGNWCASCLYDRIGENIDEVGFCWEPPVCVQCACGLVELNLGCN